jgi:hypothetical protein
MVRLAQFALGISDDETPDIDKQNTHQEPC